MTDPGFSEQKVCNDPHSRVESLMVSSTSKARACQRAARAGRTHPRKCFKLYTKKSFQNVFTNISWDFVFKCSKYSAHPQEVPCSFRRHGSPCSGERSWEPPNYLAALDDDGNLAEVGQLMSELALDHKCLKCWGWALNSSISSNQILSITAVLWGSAFIPTVNEVVVL